MKKLICLLLAICMTGSLCACGAGETELQTDMPTEMIVIKTTPATIPETMPKETVPEQTQPEAVFPHEPPVLRNGDEMGQRSHVIFSGS